MFSFKQRLKVKICLISILLIVIGLIGTTGHGSGTQSSALGDDVISGDRPDKSCGLLFPIISPKNKLCLMEIAIKSLCTISVVSKPTGTKR